MIWIWLGFIGLVFLLLALDLGVFHKDDHVVSVREAFAWTGVWISVALLFGIFVYFAYENHWLGLGLAPDAVDRVVNDGRLALTKYLTGYVIEWSLSVDNVFVMALIFASMAVPAKYQHRVLFWGILGAMVMRGVMIGIGAALVARYHWILYVFGAFLIITAIRMAFFGGEEENPTEGIALRLTRRFFRVTKDYHGHSFLVRLDGKMALTPLAVALVLVETTDLIFAVDSIPAIFAITADPFLVATSNMFAILGLRSLYFALAGAIATFQYLKYSLAAILALVGTKMLVAEWLKEHMGPSFNYWLLALIALFLVIGVAASMLKARRDERRLAAERGRPGAGVTDAEPVLPSNSEQA